jgi:hypothetical protein
MYHPTAVSMGCNPCFQLSHGDGSLVEGSTGVGWVRHHSMPSVPSLNMLFQQQHKRVMSRSRLSDIYVLPAGLSDKVKERASKVVQQLGGRVTTSDTDLQVTHLLAQECEWRGLPHSRGDSCM